jgi:hypothetical protein
MNEISKYLTLYIREQFKNIHLEKINKNHKFIKKIKKDISIANEEFYRREVDAKIHFSESTKKNKEQRQLLKGSKYEQISENIRSIIERQSFFNKVFEFSFGNPPTSVIKIHLHYFLSSQDASIRELDIEKVNIFLQKCMQKIYIWFYIANKYKLNICSKNLNIYLYLIDLPKILHSQTSVNEGKKINNDIGGSYKGYQKKVGEDSKHLLDINSVNTGFTYSCLPNDTPNEIYIYREEEWFKVLIHETFHSFGMEFSNRENLENYANRRISELFHLSLISRENIYGSGYNIFESYTEITAELMNMLIYDFLYKSNLEKIVEIEQKFSCFQCAKILEYLHIPTEFVSKMRSEKINHDKIILRITLM